MTLPRVIQPDEVRAGQRVSYWTRGTEIRETVTEANIADIRNRALRWRTVFRAVWLLADVPPADLDTTEGGDPSCAAASGGGAEPREAVRPPGRVAALPDRGTAANEARYWQDRALRAEAERDQLQDRLDGQAWADLEKRAILWQARYEVVDAEHRAAEAVIQRASRVIKRARVELDQWEHWALHEPGDPSGQQHVIDVVAAVRRALDGTEEASDA